MISIELLRDLCRTTKPSTLEVYVGPLNEVTEYYEISNTTERLAGFLAQIATESGGFTATKENLNYGAAGLLTTFKKYFLTEAEAKKYERRPEQIANKVYANRMGNGPEESGDGWKYRGRGLIQLTGKNNYLALSEALEISLDECAEYLSTPAGAVASAGWFWNTNKLNEYCDRGDFLGLTKRINGGTHGLADRQRYYALAINLLNR